MNTNSPKFMGEILDGQGNRRKLQIRVDKLTQKGFIEIDLRQVEFIQARKYTPPQPSTNIALTGSIDLLLVEFHIYVEPLGNTNYSVKITIVTGGFGYDETYGMAEGDYDRLSAWIESLQLPEVSAAE